MSVKYSTSPTLRLRVANSRHYLCCQILFITAVALALFELGRGVHPLLIGLLIPGLLSFVWRAGRQTLVGTVVCWQHGKWVLESGDQIYPIALRRWHCLPWVTFVAWQFESGKKDQIWLFSDSAPRHDLRRLRTRLRIERGI